MPNRKFIPLLEMIESQIGVSELKHFSHRSKGSVQDNFVCIGNTVKEALLEVININSFRLLIDEVTDIATCPQLISFVQHVNSSGNTEVKFLSIKDVLQAFDSCNAAAITAMQSRTLRTIVLIWRN